MSVFDFVFQESGFEVVYDDAVLRSFLSRPEAPMFEPKLFQVSIYNLYCACFIIGLYNPFVIILFFFSRTFNRSHSWI